MGKMEYLDALKQAMLGLPPDVQAKTLAYYEQRFVDGIAAGRSEEEVGRELDEPKKIAMTLRASAHLSSFSETKNPANLLRFLVTAVGLAIFNLFMVVPAAVFGALLTALYACAFGFYLGGAVVTASGLAGANEFTFKEPVRHMRGDGAREEREATVTIGPHGIQVYQDKDSAPAVVIEGAPESVVRGSRRWRGHDPWRDRADADRPGRHKVHIRRHQALPADEPLPAQGPLKGLATCAH
jgi:uncharacterized membrane protein